MQYDFFQDKRQCKTESKNDFRNNISQKKKYSKTSDHSQDSVNKESMADVTGEFIPSVIPEHVEESQGSLSKSNTGDVTEQTKEQTSQVNQGKLAGNEAHSQRILGLYFVYYCMFLHKLQGG